MPAPFNTCPNTSLSYSPLSALFISQQACLLAQRRSRCVPERPVNVVVCDSSPHLVRTVFGKQQQLFGPRRACAGAKTLPKTRHHLGPATPHSLGSKAGVHEFNVPKAHNLGWQGASRLERCGTACPRPSAQVHRSASPDRADGPLTAKSDRPALRTKLEEKTLLEHGQGLLHSTALLQLLPRSEKKAVACKKSCW